jgi:hypothetical protein
MGLVETMRENREALPGRMRAETCTLAVRDICRPLRAPAPCGWRCG